MSSEQVIDAAEALGQSEADIEKMQAAAAQQTHTEKSETFDAYDLKVHRIGRVTTFLALVTMFLPVIGIAYAYAVDVNWSETFAATLGIWAAFGLNGIVEPFTFAPMLGAGATYIAFTTGNVGQMKVPCVVNSQEIMGVKMGSKEGDVVATLATGVSTLVSTLVVFLAMIGVSIIYPLLFNPVLKPGFDNVMSALFGALAVMIFMKNPKIASLPYAVGLGVLAVMGVPWGNKNALWLMLGLIVVAVLWAYSLYKRGKV